MDDLRKFALELIAKHDGKAAAALPAFDRKLKKNATLRRRLEMEYLDSVAGHNRVDTQAPHAPTPSGGQIARDTLSQRAAAHSSRNDDSVGGQSRADTQVTDASSPSGGHVIGDTLHHAAAAHLLQDGLTVHVKQSKSFRRKESWRHPIRTEAEKASARAAMLAGSSVWRQLGLRLERVRFRELDAIIRENGGAAGARIHEGVGNIKLAAFASLIKRHVVPVDDSAFVTELISEADLNKLATIAIRQAPELAARYAKRDAEAIVEDVKLIAAE